MKTLPVHICIFILTKWSTIQPNVRTVNSTHCTWEIRQIVETQLGIVDILSRGRPLDILVSESNYGISHSVNDSAYAGIADAMVDTCVESQMIDNYHFSESTDYR